jgi:predicted NACHT family NTPase/formylglycine-generating enzyme required for sulfatase activity
MPIIESVISEIVKKSAGKAWKSANRKDKILGILNNVGLTSGSPDPNFDSVYAHTLVEYGIDKPKPILDFFRHKDIRKAFQQSFGTEDFSILNREAETLIEWHRIGDDLREQNIDPRLEFARFALVFNAMVDRTRTPVQTRSEQKLDKIIRLIEKGDLNAIRVKSLEIILGSLAEQLKAWFGALGYHFGDHTIENDEYCEWIIKIPGRRGFDSILVRCIEGQAEMGDLEQVREAVVGHQTDERWLVVPHRKSKLVCETADNDEKLFCYTFDELLDEHADFSRYFKWLDSFVKERNIHVDYIPLACKRDIYDETSKEKIHDEHYGKEEDWIEGYIDRWLDDPCTEHISILGEFGTGKTWFTHHYAYQIMQRYIKAKEKGLKRPRMPLVVQLRDYSKALSSESLFSDFFFRKHEIPLPGYSAFEQLNRMGKLLLIFDGFDEMADKLDRQKMINNFWELARVVVPGAKAVLTCRTEHFPNAREGRDLLSAELKASTSNLTGDPPQFEILELEKFDEEQIRSVLAKKTDRETLDRIMEHPDLLDLAGRPIMLEFIVEALKDIEADKHIDLSRIYLYAIRAKLNRDIKSERTFTSLADKIYFMCELSWEMLTTEKMTLNYRLFPDRLKRLFGPIVAEEKDLDHWNYDMMGNTLLVRNDEGDYTPSHRSLVEFFVSLKAVVQLGMLPQDFTETCQNRSANDIDTLCDPTDYTWNDYFTRDVDENGEIRLIPPLRRFCSDDTDTVLSVLGRSGDAVLRFVHEMTNVDEVRDDFHGLLARILDEFKDGSRDPEHEQDIVSYIIRFRALSQEWEELSDKGDPIRRFWKNHLQLEVDDTRNKAKQEMIHLNRHGNDPLEIDMVQVPVGSFLMGDEDDKPIHRVDVTRPFMIGTVPVTQALYNAVMGEHPSHFIGDELPVEKVSWFDAVRFCNDLSIRIGLEPSYRIKGDKVEWNQGSLGFRLPTEAEWEYACRAGSTTLFSCGDLISDLRTVCWYGGTSEGNTHPVGRKASNAWGIFDMHGNVWEWVWDTYSIYPGGLVSNPAVSEKKRGAYRVIRGGSWSFDALYCRSAFRRYSPDYRSNGVGFRLSRSVSLGH